ncbi:MAG: phosphate acetyltransferase [Desulfovibrio sp.]|nr:phosphate acetyltransferase [Desulfovibrio sp.]
MCEHGCFCSLHQTIGGSVFSPCTGLHAETIMKKNILSLLGSASQDAFYSVVPCILSLAAGNSKQSVLVDLDGASAKSLEASCKGQAEVKSPAVLGQEVESLAGGKNFLLLVGHTGTDLTHLENDAEQAAAASSPIFFLLDVKGASCTDIVRKMQSVGTIFASKGAYLLGTLLFGCDLTKAEEDSLQKQFGKKGESPLYFLGDEKASEKAFVQSVNTEELVTRLCSDATVMGPNLFEIELARKARAVKQKIVLAEGAEERILRATEVLLQRKVADIVLLGDSDEITTKAQRFGLDIKNAEIITPSESPKFDDYANTYYELRKKKGVTEDDAKKVMLDPTVFGTMMVKKGDADGMVSGAVNTTAHTIRPALQFVKAKPGFSVVSSCFLMCLADRVLVFADCAVNPNPTAEQLAEIAITTAQTAMAFGIEPRVAMISYSSGSSGKGPDVDLVIEATKLAQEKDPTLVIDGPLQYDAAIDPTVAKTKMPDSPVAGKATVFIFPNLTTGNTTYKAVQRACDAIAIGPVLQGLNKPVNDLSRGCLVADIVNTVAITAVQAASEK